jgi:multicomponent Na+:H+ antiporter subunit B
MGIELIMIIILIFILLGAIIAVEIKDLLSAVISIGVVGFGISIAFLFLQAPDLAIVQIAVETILLVLLIRATIRRDIKSTHAHINWVGLICVMVLCLGLIGFGYFAFLGEIEFGEPAVTRGYYRELPFYHYLENGLQETGSANIVTSIILDYRAYDTLGEATVLFTAIIGALAILRGVARKKKGGKQ